MINKGFAKCVNLQLSKLMHTHINEFLFALGHFIFPAIFGTVFWFSSPLIPILLLFSLPVCASINNNLLQAQIELKLPNLNK